ncbi:uncharacterized protein PV07_05124 [Cladophialophora immunda]|uniref:AAA+ ATPase domain-containing protein n=1 Tax=Cladophialophora immunda TaxID=569365 RepID=A0A0D2D0H9_9EURO|nr:uncharacterized protein PV07_05124 [Cladophialophora immunda]KIW29299.1 hypothetical protein PV07_05124 [Cladophialophora immunda]OQV08462.1 hypothetical protein CLAIMM_12733 [Cladophialophora immunda]
MSSLHPLAQLHMALPNQSDPNVSSSSIHLPLTVLDTLVPGSSHLASFLLGFGLDVSLFVSWGALLTTVWAALHFGLVPAYQIAVKALSSSVIVEEYDPIYNHVLNWASAQKYLQDIRSLRAHTAGQYYDDLEDHDEDDGLQMRFRESLSEDTIFNFNNWSARAPPTFRPHSSSGWFFHNHRLFKLYRSRDRVASDFTGAVYERERLEISVIWLSPKPIKNMIQEAREFHLIRRTSTTTIKRPTPKSQRSGRGQAWTTIANRPSRSMATVVLDNDQKAAILKDFNDFLHPRTARWYSNRGIPYRRGYLFHGPPGTGKTSLSFALAGVFGLDIYCLALSEATLTEEDLILLFNSLPKRCILLLEDIDSAGLGRAPGARGIEKQETTKPLPSSKDTQPPTKPAGGRGDKDGSAGGAGKASDQPHSFGKDPTFKNTLTFAGLLNAIDGVASQEGRVLIMTTNHLERLDEALTRPGRIDLTIEFDLATKQQIKDLFLRMYCVDSAEMRRQPTKISHILPNQGEPDWSSANAFKDGDGVHAEYRNAPEPWLGLSREAPDGGASVVDLAERFAAALPERTLSPAEIQGFLLVRKKCPAQAVVDVVEWRDEQLQKKTEANAAKEAAAKATGLDDEGNTKSSEGVKMASSSSRKQDATSDLQHKGVGGMQNAPVRELTGQQDGQDAMDPTSSRPGEPDAESATIAPRDQTDDKDDEDGTMTDGGDLCGGAAYDPDPDTADDDSTDGGAHNRDRDRDYSLSPRPSRPWFPHARTGAGRGGRGRLVDGDDDADGDGDCDCDSDSESEL